MPKDRVVAAMVGDASGSPGDRRRAGTTIAPTSRPDPVLELHDAHLDGIVSGVSLQVAAGECVELAGLAGSGKGEIGDAIAGLLAPSVGKGC
jgi:simple sugar transport system ATP-binding protein